MFTEHIVDEYTIKNVPCRNIEGIGIVYYSTTMSRILKLLPIMKKNNILILEYEEEINKYE